MSLASSLECSQLAKTKVLPVLLLVLSAVFTGPLAIPQIHGQTGTVCFADPSFVFTGPCPSSPAVFSGPIGQLIRIGVFISGSDGLNSFDITMLANSAFLKPAGIDLQDTVLLGTPTVVLECLGGNFIAGTVCSATDNASTIHLAAVSGIGQGLTATPTTGLLFTGIFNITATTSLPGIPVGFQTGCTSTSVPGGVCVSVANGTPNSVPENIQTGTLFENSGSATMANVVLSANQTSFGPQFPSTPNSANVTATAVNGYPTALVTDQVNFTTTSTTGLTAGLSASSCATTGTSCSITLTLSATAAGNYFVTLYGSYATQDSLGNPDTLVSYVAIEVIVYDFGLAVSPTTLSFISGEIGTATATISSLNGFSGIVTLSTGVNIPAGMTVTFNPNPLTLNAGQTLTCTITFKASPAGAQAYHAQIKAASGPRSKTFTPTLTINVAAPTPDFYFLATPGSIGPINAGASGDSKISVIFVNGFTGPVSLAVTSSSTNAQGTLNQTSLSTSHNVTLTGSSLLAGSYSLNVTGTGSPQGVRFIVVALSVVDFNLTASPNPIEVSPGSFVTTAVSVTALNGFSGTVSLTTSTPTGLTAVLSQNTITGSGSVLVNVTASSGIAAGTFAINVTGVSSPLSHVIHVNVTVLPSDFRMTAAPSALTARPLENATSTLTISSLNGFVGTVNLSVQSPAAVIFSLNQTFTAMPVTLSSGSSAVVVLTLNATSTGSFHINVTGVSGSLTHTLSLDFTSSINDFAVSANPTTILVNAGTTQTSTITVASTGSFSQSVALSVSENPSSGLSCSVNPTSVTPPAGASATSTLSCSGSGGVYVVTVSGTSSGFSAKTVDVTFTVQDFSLTVNPTSVQVNLPARGNSTVTISALGGFGGVVQLSANYTSTICQLSPASVTGAGGSALSCKFTLSGSYHVMVTGTSGSLSHNAIVTIRVGDFDIVSLSSSFIVEEGSSHSFLVNLASVDGFQGSISLSSVVLKPVGFSGTGIPVATLSTSTVTLTASGSGSSQNITVTVTVGRDVVPQSFGIEVNATSGSGATILVRTSVPVSLQVPNPGVVVTSSPTSIIVGPDGSGSGTVTLTAQNGMNGTVTLALSYSKAGVSCSLAKTSLHLLVDGSNSTGLSCNGSIGSYTVTITVSGTLPYGAQQFFSGDAGFVVADFSISATPSGGILINAGQTGHAQIAIKWVSNYNGTVTFTVAPVAGLNTSITSSSLTGSGTTTLDVVSNAGGTYTVTVTGASGSDTHAVTFTVTVLSPENVNILGLAPEVFYSIVGLVILAVAGVGLLVYRRSAARKRA